MKPFTVEESENIQKVNDALMKQNQELKEKIQEPIRLDNEIYKKWKLDKEKLEKIEKFVNDPLDYTGFAVIKKLKAILDSKEIL